MDITKGDKLSERLATPETISLEEVASQQQAFFEAAQNLEQTFGLDEDHQGPIRVTGSVDMTWKVPEGYACQVTPKDGKPRHATNMYEHARGEFIGSGEGIQFDETSPLPIHEIRAFARAGGGVQYNFVNKGEADLQQSFSVNSDRLNDLYILPHLKG
jgi:hypothetical protein